MACGAGGSASLKHRLASTRRVLSTPPPPRSLPGQHESPGKPPVNPTCWKRISIGGFARTGQRAHLVCSVRLGNRLGGEGRGKSMRNVSRTCFGASFYAGQSSCF